MKNIMMEGNLKAFADLDTLGKNNLYALGPVENLQGEILILNGKIYRSRVVGKVLDNKTQIHLKAAMLVYARVAEWKTLEVKANLKSYQELEKLITKTALKQGYSLEKPFAFQIKAKPKSLNFHVIDWDTTVQHTMENHKQFALKGKFENSEVTLLGFASSYHHSIFTHHTTNMHIHILEDKTNTVGHLDNISITGKINLYLLMN